VFESKEIFSKIGPFSFINLLLSPLQGIEREGGREIGESNDKPSEKFFSKRSELKYLSNFRKRNQKRFYD